MFDAVKLEKVAEFRLLVDHHADLYVHLKGRSLAECLWQSDCQSIREACLGLNDTAPTRELARNTAYRHGGRWRINDQFSNETILTIRLLLLQDDFIISIIWLNSCCFTTMIAIASALVESWESALLALPGRVLVRDAHRTAWSATENGRQLIFTSLSKEEVNNRVRKIYRKIFFKKVN